MSAQQRQRKSASENEDDRFAQEIMNMGGDEGDEEEEQELNEEEIVQVIIQLGNEILRNLGVEEPIDDVAVFFSDEFYIQFFQAAFPEIDFSQLTAGQDVNEMAENIQALIDLLGEQILKYDLGHIKGEEIVHGNPEHCINLLQLVQEISVMIQQKGGANGIQPQSNPMGGNSSSGGELNSQQKQLPQLVDDSGDEFDPDGQHLHQDQEDDEAQLISDPRQQHNRLSSGGRSSGRGRAPGGPQNNNQLHGSGGANNQQFEMDGDDYEDNQDEDGEMDEIQRSVDFDEEEIRNQLGGGSQRQHHHNLDEEDDDELEQQLMQQLQNQPEILQKKRLSEDHQNVDDDDEPMDDDELQMYEQFLANNKQQEQKLAMNMKGEAGPSGNHHHHNHQQEEDDGEDEEIDIDNIDYDQLDPQILELAQQMGVHPKEVLKQIMQMNENGEIADEMMMDDQDEDEDGIDPRDNQHMGEDDYGLEMPDYQMQHQQQQPSKQEQAAREEQLRREKEQFKMQMMGKAAPVASQSDKKSQGQSKVHPEPAKQQQQQQHYQLEEDDDYGHDDDDESYYSEGEMETRIKLINQKSYSAPYLIASDCYQEPLCDDEDDDDSQGQLPSKAYSTTVLQSLQFDDQQQNQHMHHHQHQDSENHQDTANLLHQQQKKLQQKQSAQKKNNMFMQNADDDDEDVDVDISQKLLELQQNQQQQQSASQKKKPASNSSNNKQSSQQNRMMQMQQQQQEQEDDEEDQEGEDEDEMMIDLDQLDEHNREMLLEYLKQEYDKNPGQFQIPKELIEGFINKKGGEDAPGGHIKDIKSQEMVLEDVSGQQDSQSQIIGGGQAIEEEGQREDEIHEEDEEGAEYLDDPRNQDGEDQGDEEEDEQGLIGDINQQQLYQQQMMMMHQQQQMQQQFLQQQQQQQMKAKQTKKASKAGGKKGKKASTATNGRPKSAGRGAKNNKNGAFNQPMMPLPNNVMTNIVGQQVQHEIIQEEEDDSEQQQQNQLQHLGPQIPEDQLQQIIQLLQEQQIDLENVDPNLIQQLLIAQQQQMMQGQPPQVLAAQSQPRSGRQQQRPSTAGRKRSGSKKRNGASVKTLDSHVGVKSLKPYSQAQLSYAKSKLAKVYPAQVSERLTSSNKKRVASTGPLNAGHKKKKQRPMTAQQKQLKLQQQQLMQIFPQLSPEEQQMLIQQGFLPDEFILQLLQQQQQVNNAAAQQPLMVEDQDVEGGQQVDHDEGEDNENGGDSPLEQPEVADLNTLQPQMNQNPLLEIPNFTKEYLNQLTEEQLEQLVQQQQQLMIMQNLQQQQQQLQQQYSDHKPRSSSSRRPTGGIARPKSAKTQGGLKSLRPASASKKSGVTSSYNGFQPYIAKSNTHKKLVSTAASVGSKMPKKKKSKRHLMSAAPAAATQGVLMNNFFPALEGGGSPNMYQGGPTAGDPRYSKFAPNGVAANNPNMMVQDQIDEVPREEEEAESQENIHQGSSGIQASNFYQPTNININPSASNQEDNEAQMISGDDEETANGGRLDQDNANPGQSQNQDQDEEAGVANQISASGIELSDEQLFELLQNYQYLSPEQQQQLQIILEQRTPEMLMMQQQMMQQQDPNDRHRSYQNIYDILMENVKRAKDRLAPLGQVSVHQNRTVNGVEDTEETDRRIIRQKQEFETLYRQYQNELKARELKKKDEDAHLEKRLQRESRIQAIRERKFHDELLQHQKSLNYKRNAQQVMLCQKVYKLASELEKNKLLQEKREFKENQEKKKHQNKLMVDAIETYYKNQVQLLKERIEQERFERRVAQQAQQQALTRMKRELNEQKKLEVERYLQLLKQEDSRYEFESSNINKIEHEIVKMYKKGK